MAILTRPPARNEDSAELGNGADFREAAVLRRGGVASRDESADPLPHLLLELEDELARSRRREAAWLSVITHLLLILILLFSPKLNLFSSQSNVVALERLPESVTYLALPPDLQKKVPPPKTNILSDKDRVATSPRPLRAPLPRIPDPFRPGAPGKPAQASPPAPPSTSAQASPPAQAPAGSPEPAAPQAPAQQASNSLLPPPAPQRGEPAKSPSDSPFRLGPSSVEQAAAATAPGRGAFSGGTGGDYGLGNRGPANARSNFDVLSDTRGVDFGPYLSRVVSTVRRNWYGLIPESAKRPFFTQGKVSIRFRIEKDGKVSGVTVEGPSGRRDLDEAALGSITLSNPFQPLPREFDGADLSLRFHFYYNPDRDQALN